METIYIKNGRVFSGYDEPSRIANVLVQDGKVARISAAPIAVENAKVIDATGQWVLPGFVDNHTHYDGEIAKNVSACF